MNAECREMNMEVCVCACVCVCVGGGGLTSKLRSRDSISLVRLSMVCVMALIGSVVARVRTCGIFHGRVNAECRGMSMEVCVRERTCMRVYRCVFV